VAWFDRQGVLLKYYPFRINSLALFSTALLAVAYLRKMPVPTRESRGAALGALVGCAADFASILAPNIIRIQNQADPLYSQLLERIGASTPPDAVFMFDPNDKKFLDFSRRTRREQFVSWKVEPSGGSKLFEWYSRLKLADAIDRDPSHLDGLQCQWRVDYFL